MRTGSFAMDLDPRDLGFEEGDPIRQFVERVRGQVFSGQPAGGIQGNAGEIVVHQHGPSTAMHRPLPGLLSMRADARAVIRPRGCRGEVTGGSMIMGRRPDTMRAMGFDAPGGPDVLRVEQCPVPQPSPDQVLIKVAYAGVNRPDVIQRQGLYPPPPGASPIPGLEVSGTIVALGDRVPELMHGQAVTALVSGGGYAEYCLAHARHCLAVPARMDLAEAGAIPETLFTVWHNVFERGWAKPGETLLVHGGTSGIGTMATMLGKAFDLKVITTNGSAAKCSASRKLGADLAIDYREQDYVEAVQTFTSGEGVAIVLDMVSGDYVARNLECLATDGRHVTIAVLCGLMAELNFAKVMTKRLTLTGSTLRPRSDAFKALLADEIAQNAWPLFESGALHPVMDKTFALEDAAAAHRRMEGGEHIGKIVLEI